MKYRTGLIASMIGNFAGLLFAGLMQVRCYNYSVSGIIAFASFIGGPISNIIYGIIGVLVGWIVTFVFSYIMYKDEKNKNEEA